MLDGIRAMIKSRVEAIKESKRFLELVENETKPIRREAYLKEKKRLAINEGKELARKEVNKEEKKPQIGEFFNNEKYFK